MGKKWLTNFDVIWRVLHQMKGSNGFTSPPKECMLRIFFALKNLTALDGFEVNCKVYHLPAQHVMKA
jgi:hypothetical protein